MNVGTSSSAGASPGDGGSASAGPRFPASVLLAAVMGLLFAGACWTAGEHPGLPIDDAWIHLSFARTFSETGSWALTPDSPAGSGTTGYLWALILALGMLAGLPPVAAALVPGVLAFVGLAAAVRRVSRRALGASFLAEACACAVALSGNLLFFAASGMETILLLWLLALAIDRHQAGDTRGRGRALFALALTRPDGVLGGAILAFAELGPRDRPLGERLRRATAAALPALAGLVLLTGLNLATGGEPMPATFEGRRWLVGLPSAVSLEPGAIARESLFLARAWWGHVRDLHYSMVFSSPLRETPWLTGLDARVAALQLLLAILGLLGAAGRRAGALRLLISFAGAQLLLYAWLLASPGAAGRYQPALALLAALLPFGGLALLESVMVSPAGRRVVSGLTAVLLSCMALNAATWWQATASSTALLDRTHCTAGRWCAERLAPGARLAAFDVGGIAFHRPRGIVDFSGLTDPRAARALRAARTLRYLQDRGATHLALTVARGAATKESLAYFGLYRHRGDREPSPGLEELASFGDDASPPWHFALLGHAHTRMKIFEIDWSPSLDEQGAQLDLPTRRRLSR